MTMMLQPQTTPETRSMADAVRVVDQERQRTYDEWLRGQQDEANRPWDYRMYRAADEFIAWVGPIRLVRLAGMWGKTLVRWALSFAFAHARGYVSACEAAYRLSRCLDHCPHHQAYTKRTLFMRRPYLGHYCIGPNNGGCGGSRPCPKTRISGLQYKTRLWNFECPAGRFPAGEHRREEK